MKVAFVFICVIIFVSQSLVIDSQEKALKVKNRELLKQKNEIAELVKENNLYRVVQQKHDIEIMRP